MLLNFILGFIIPWIFGIVLYKKTSKILLTIFPIGTVLSHIINAFVEEYKVWEIAPEELLTVDYLIFDIGLYAILPSYLIFFIHKYRKLNAYTYILIFTIVTTVSEYTWLKEERVSCHNGWNIYLTFLSYLVPYILVYLYYLLLKKNNILDNDVK